MQAAFFNIFFYKTKKISLPVCAASAPIARAYVNDQTCEWRIDNVECGVSLADENGCLWETSLTFS